MPTVEAIFFGVKAAVLVIVVEALLQHRAAGPEAGGALGDRGACSFIAIFFLALPFPLIVFAAGASRLSCARSGEPRSQGAAAPAVITPLSQTLRTIAVWLAIWLTPLLALAAIFGRDHVLTQLGWFFSKLAIVTFGGAYAVLAYMAQDVVVTYGWLEAGQMIDGLGLAETTPGPLILVTEFVGFLAAWRAGGEAAWALGCLGALTALWATFAPCFLWIFAGAPYVEWITAQPRLRAALSAITAAVVGVIFNLALWFALHVFFGKVTLIQFGIFNFWTPDFAALDWRVMLLAAVSGILLLRLHWGIPAVLGVSSALALALRFGGL